MTDVAKHINEMMVIHESSNKMLENVSYFWKNLVFQSIKVLKKNPNQTLNFLIPNALWHFLTKPTSTHYLILSN